MEGDYRFSFILPVRPEMLRKVPAPVALSSPAPAVVENQPADQLSTDGATATAAH
jgi:hypothetical protein